MITARYLIGFTGHRSGFDESKIRPVLRQTLVDLKSRAEKHGGRAELYASVAEGADTLCVELARELGMPVHIVLPLPDEQFVADFSSPAAWDRAAAQIRTARERPGRDSVHCVTGESSRPECYFNQAIRILDAVDVLVAVWDGLPSRGLGGTAQAVSQAKAIGLPMVQISSVSGEITTTGKIESRFEIDPAISELNQIGGSSFPAATPGELLDSLDQAAITEAKRFRPSIVRVILLHGIAALLAALVTFKIDDNHPWDRSKWIITASELLLVSIALWMSFRLHRKHTQNRWIRCRFACEIVRGLLASVPLLDPLHPAISRHDPRWRRFALSAGLFVLEHNTADAPLPLRDHYLSVRLSREHRAGQILHFRAMQPAAVRWWKITGTAGLWTASLAPLFVFLSLGNKLSKYLPAGKGWHLDESPWTWPFVVFLPIALPLIAGVAGSLRHVLDAARRKDHYPQLVERLEEIRAALPGLQTPSTIRAAVSRSEEILLDELLEWELAMKNAGH